MPPPSNTTAGTAIAIGALPYSNTQQVTDAGTCYTVWYSITGILGTLAISVTAANATGAGTYVPDLSFYASDGVTPIIDTNVPNPIQVGTLAATTYYIKIAPDVPDLSSAMMELTVLPSPTAPILASYVLINDDSNSFAPLPGVIFNPNTSTVVNLVFPLAQGEGGDIFQSGVIALENFSADEVIFYSPDFNVVAVVDLTPAFGFLVMRVNHALDLLIVLADKGANSLINTYNDAGVQQSSITAVGLPGATSVALANNGTTMYYASSGIVKRWDIGLNSAMSDFAAAVGTYSLSDILVLDNDDVLVLYPFNGSGGNVFIRRYDAAGVVQQTYDLGAPSFVFNPSGSVPRMTYDANGGQTAFWVYWFPVIGIARTSKIQISDGTVLLESNIGAYQVGESTLPNPSNNFGPSLSCPIIILGDNNVFDVTGSNGDGTLFVIAADPVPTTDLYAIRRLRRAPHLSEEQFNQFFSMLQIEMQTGVGLTTGQGSDPQLMLRWSDDGGFTWSNEHWVSAGKIGEYTRRAIWRRLGRGRDRVFEVTMTDPVVWALLEAEIQATRGTS